MPNTPLEAALHYAGLGYAVFPCVPDGKRPATAHGLKDATTDKTQINLWWEENPLYNVAIRTDGLCVVDVDPGGQSWLIDHLDDDLLTTARAVTPRGGRHYWYKQNGEPLGNTAGKIAEHIDTRANGGYVLVAPSIVDGKPYAWSRDLASGPSELPTVPHWITEALRVAPAADEFSRENTALQPLDVVAKGQRNDWLYRRASALRGQGLDESEILTALRSLNKRLCKPPLSDKELRLLTGSAGKFETNEEANPPELPRFASLVDLSTFLSRDTRPEFLVKDILVKGQPLVVGGRSKTLKTSLIVDLVLSLGAGAPFLGEFDSQQQRVAFWSGESGEATLRETAARIVKAKGIDPATCQALFSFDLPKLGRHDHLDVMRAVIESQGLQVVIVDPLYLSLLDATTAGSAGNVYAMGSVLQPLAEMAQEMGITLILLHHFRKSGQPDPEDPCNLEELSQSGAAEWARQWMLLQRREPYKADGEHRLWMRAGGSAGHAGLYAVDVSEGVYDPLIDARFWSTTVRRGSDARAEMQAKRSTEKEARREAIQEDKRQRVLGAVRRFPEGESRRTIYQSVEGVGWKTVYQILDELIESGEVEKVAIAKYNRPEEGVKPCFLDDAF